MAKTSIQQASNFLYLRLFPCILLQVLALRIYPVHELHALLIHCKHNTAAHDQPHQPRHGAAPKSAHALILQNHARAAKGIAVELLGLDALHARLDRVERLRDKDSHQARQAANGKGAGRAQLLAGRCVGLGDLLEERVGAEAGGAVGRLAQRRGDEALEEATDAALAGDDGDGVEEASHAGRRRLAVVDPVCACISKLLCREKGAARLASQLAYSVVLMLSVGVTARRDSVMPAPKPARTVRGPESLPFSSASRLLYWSNATNPNGTLWLVDGHGTEDAFVGTTYGFRPWLSFQ